MTRPELILLSAHSAEGLVALGERWRRFLVAQPSLSLSALAAQAAREQHHLPVRRAIVARTVEELAQALAAPSVSPRAPVPPRVALVYSGGGSQWPRMGTALAREEPAFRAALEACDAALARELGWSVLDELGRDAERSRLEQVEIFHGAIFATQVALTALWAHYGVRPAVVVGHSLGELGAAAASGALTLEDAARIVACRGRLQGSHPGSGTAAVVGLSYAQASARVQPHAREVAVAASNGPRMTVISGATARVQALVSELSAEGVYCRFIKGATVAPHSPQMDPLMAPLRRELAGLRPRPGHTPLYSTVDVARVDGAALGPDYWARNLREPVRFAEAIAALGAEVDRFVEVSAHPVLLPAIDETLGQGGRTVPTLKRDHGEREVFLSSLGALYVAGAELRWEALGADARGPAVPVLEPPRRAPAVEVPAAPAAAPVQPLSPAHEALLALDAMQAELDQVRAEAHEPIAVVSMACRFAGGADTPEKLWTLLEQGHDPVGEIPADRFDVEAWFDPHGGPGKMATKRGGFLPTADVQGFDPLFFGLSPREAMVMDPQQRLLLEVSHQALERAGLPPERLAATKTGVYAGVCSSDYYHSLSQHAEAFDGYAMTGNIHSFAVGRVAYLFDLQGPSLVVDTACSSSLVAVHLAVKALRSRECDVALAGGVNLILSPASMVFTSVMNALAPDGRAKAFDASADGTNRGEGCGVVVLERLSDARAHGHPVLAVIRGTALNHDGRSNGMTAPSVHAQAAVIRAALEDGGLQAADVEYVEAHGTGTKLGDPIEIEALKATYGARPAGDRPVYVSAIKSNVGHTEAASGVAGLIKAVLALQHGMVPGVLHFRALNPHIELRGSALTIPGRLEAWPRGAGPRRAAVSAFGASGTNAHVVLEEAEAAPPPARDAGPWLLLVSALDGAALDRRLLALADALTERPELALADVAYTLAAGRTHHPHRVAIVATDVADAVVRLRGAVGAGRTHSGPRPRLRIVGAHARWAALQASDAGAEGELVVGEAVLEGVAEAYVRGVELDWSAVHRGGSVVLPTYPLQRRRLWAPVLDAPPETAFRATPPGLRGTRLDVAGVPHRVYERALSAEAPAYLGQHRLFDTPLLPAAAHVELVLAHADGARVLEDLRFEEALTLPGSGARGVQVVLGPDERGVRRAEVYSGRAGDWTRHATASVRRAASSAEAWPARPPWGAPLELAPWYESLGALGLRFGPDFRALVRVSAGEGEAVGRAVLPPHLSPEHYLVHPVLLDACFQVAGPALSSTGVGATPYVPVGIERVAVRGPLGAEATCHARVRGARGLDEQVVDLWIDDAAGRPTVEVRGLVLRRLGARAALGLGASGLLDWLYRVDWTPAPPSTGRAPTAPRRWVVLADRGGLGEALAARLGARVVYAGDRCELAGERWVVRPDVPADHAALAAALSASALDGVVYLWSLDAPPRAALRGVLEALLARASASTEQLVLITRGAVEDDEVSLGGAVLWGFGRALAAEWPGRVRLIDVEASTAVDTLAAELEAGDPEVVYRGAERRLSRLARVPRSALAASAYRWRADATYLVLGGLGAVGFEMARRMVAAGVQHVVLAGRSPPPPALEVAVAQLSRAADVRVVRLDVGSGAAVRALIDELYAGPFPLAGVLHSAGVTADAVISNQSWASFEHTLAPKLDGSAHLLEAIGERPVDFVAFFASGASMLGSPGQSNYAAANAAQDALASRARARGRPVLSIDWGPWTGVGGPERQVVEALWAKRGVSAIDPERGFALLEHLLAGAPSPVAVLPIDWPRFAESWPGARDNPIFGGLLGERSSGSSRATPTVSILDALAAAPTEARHGLIVGHVAGIVARVLCVEPTAVDTHAPLNRLGMDSLVALQVKHKIEVDLGVAVPVVELLRGAPIDELCRALDPARAAPPSSPAPVAPPPTPAAEAQTLLEKVETLSDDEVERELAKLLAGGG